MYIISTQIGKGDKVVCGQTTTLEVMVERLRNDPDGQNEADKYQMLMFKGSDLSFLFLSYLVDKETCLLDLMIDI